MADTIDRKRVTLHPLKDDGTMDLNTNLYPKTFLDGIVNRDGEEVDVVTQPELDEAIDNIEQELQALPLEFYIDTGKVRVSLEDWMTKEEEIQKNVTMNINGYLFLCKLYKSITSKGGELSIYLETGNIRMQCNGDPTVSENWNVNLDEYFPPIYDDSNFAPYLEISNGEVIDDNVINPQWVTDFDDRADVLGSAPAKAWVGSGDDWEPCTIYSKFSEDGILICIQTSKGEYKLTYQFESDPK